MAPWPTSAWGCVEVQHCTYGLAVWSEKDGGMWCELSAIAEWGCRVWMPEDRH